MIRHLTVLDRFIIGCDAALRTVCPPSHRSVLRKNPASSIEESVLTVKEKQHVAGLMRVNHAGEVCAQALYQGQSLSALSPSVQARMRQAAKEEIDHLAWCEERLQELSSCPGLFNPVWYTGAFIIGFLAGYCGDQWSLGFVAETERQVTEHLQSHLQKLPAQDAKTRALLIQMQTDEAQHAEQAQLAGAIELPDFIQQCMRFAAKLMTKTNYYL